MTQPLHGRSDDCTALAAEPLWQSTSRLQSLKTNLCEDAELEDVWLWTGLKGKNVTEGDDNARRSIKDLNALELQSKLKESATACRIAGAWEALPLTGLR